MPSFQAKLATILLRRQFAGWSTARSPNKPRPARTLRQIHAAPQTGALPAGGRGGVPTAWIETPDATLGVMLCLSS